MSSYPVQFINVAVVPCSHCNINGNGSEPGICHRNLTGNGDSCWTCTSATHGANTGIIMGTILSAIGELRRTPCSYCDGNGYRKL